MIKYEELMKIAEERGLELQKVDGELAYLFNKPQEFCVCVNTTNEEFTVFYAVGVEENVVCVADVKDFSNKEAYARTVFQFKQRRDLQRRQVNKSINKALKGRRKYENQGAGATN